MTTLPTSPTIDAARSQLRRHLRTQIRAFQLRTERLDVRQHNMIELLTDLRAEREQLDKLIDSAACLSRLHGLSVRTISNQLQTTPTAIESRLRRIQSAGQR